MRVRADTLNAFAEFLGEPVRVDRQAPARGYHLTPGDTERLLHDLTVKRPIHANAMTALRTAAVAAVIADTGHGVPEIADLKLSALHLDGDAAGGQEASVDLDGESYPLTRSTVHVLTRWLAARGSLIAELEGSDPGYLWIPTKPGRPRGGVPSAKPGISPAAVRTLHASHRALVSQLLGTPLRPGALRAAAVSLSVSTGDASELSLLHDHEFLSWSRSENINGTPPPPISGGSTSTPRPSSSVRSPRLIATRYPERRRSMKRRRCGRPASRPRSCACPRRRCRPS